MIQSFESRRRAHRIEEGNLVVDHRSVLLLQVLLQHFQRLLPLHRHNMIYQPDSDGNSQVISLQERVQLRLPKHQGLRVRPEQ